MCVCVSVCVFASNGDDDDRLPVAALQPAIAVGGKWWRDEESSDFGNQWWTKFSSYSVICASVNVGGTNTYASRKSTNK